VNEDEKERIANTYRKISQKKKEEKEQLSAQKE
jgi:hypothetical protein